MGVLCRSVSFSLSPTMPADPPMSPKFFAWLDDVLVSRSVMIRWWFRLRPMSFRMLSIIFPAAHRSSSRPAHPYIFHLSGFEAYLQRTAYLRYGLTQTVCGTYKRLHGCPCMTHWAHLLRFPSTTHAVWPQAGLIPIEGDTLRSRPPRLPLYSLADR
jgi:hypothetical protein